MYTMASPASFHGGAWPPALFAAAIKLRIAPLTQLLERKYRFGRRREAPLDRDREFEIRVRCCSSEKQAARRSKLNCLLLVAAPVAYRLCGSNGVPLRPGGGAHSFSSSVFAASVNSSPLPSSIPPVFSSICSPRQCDNLSPSVSLAYSAASILICFAVPQ